MCKRLLLIKIIPVKTDSPLPCQWAVYPTMCSQTAAKLLSTKGDHHALKSNSSVGYMTADRISVTQALVNLGKLN